MLFVQPDGSAITGLPIYVVWLVEWVTKTTLKMVTHLGTKARRAILIVINPIPLKKCRLTTITTHVMSTMMAVIGSGKTIKRYNMHNKQYC